MSRAPSPVYKSQVEHYRERQRAFAEARSDDPSWLSALRAAAVERFAEIGFPSTRLEEWKYTNLAPVAKLALEPEGAEPVLEGSSPFVTSLQSHLERAPDALRARLAAAPDEKERAFALLNSAFLADGAVVSIPDEQDLTAPIRIELPAPGDGRLRQTRVLIDVGAGSRAVVALRQATAETPVAGLSNLVVDAELGANASLDLVLLQPGGRAGDDTHTSVSTISVRVARDARFRSHTLTTGAALARNDLDVVLSEEGSECELRGLFVGRAKQLLDNHTSVDHAVPHCRSQELYKGVLGGRSKGVFRGRVIVRPDAQKTDASQSNPNLLLTEGAEIDTKPQLEIHADDVKCSHGATVGQLDPDALFYLRSRAIGLLDAREMLVRAFANEILEALPEGVPSHAISDDLRAVLEGARS